MSDICPTIAEIGLSNPKVKLVIITNLGKPG